MAYENDVLTRNDNDELAVRTVSATEGSGSSSYDDIYTRDTNGKLAVRVVGAGGGGGGAVSSVNGKTGAVVLNAEDVGAIPQVSVLPTASASNLGNIVQYVGATTEDYTNGYFYKCVASDSGVGSGEIDVTYWYPNQFTPPVTGSVDVDVFSQYLEQNNLPPLSDGRIEITFQPNSNNIIFAYNVDTNWTRVDIPWTTVTTQAAEDIFANMGFDFDFSGIPTNRETATGGHMPSATVYFWKEQPVMDSIGVYKDDLELPESTEENVGTTYLVAPYDSETFTPYTPAIYMSVPYIVNYIDGEAEVTGYGLTPETQPTDVMIDWATLENYLDSQETGFYGTNDSINISLNGENFLDVMYNENFSAIASVQTDGTVANIQQELENIGISVDLTGYTQFQFMSLKLPTEKGYENRQVPAFVPSSGPAESDYVLKADGNGGTYWAAESGGSGLPDQTGQSGKFLTTDGTDASWAEINALQNTSTGSNSLTILGTPTSENSGTNVGKLSRAEGAGTTAYGWYAEARAAGATAVGSGATVRNLGGIALGRGAESNDGEFMIALWDNQKHQYAMCDMGGNVPSDRLKNAINKYSTMPTAASTNEGWIVQFTGPTNGTYTHGYLYECVSDGADPATYSWTEVQLGGGGGLQNTAISSGSLTILGEATSNSESINIGQQSEVHDDYSVAFGNYARTSHSEKSVVIGFNSAAIDIQNTQQYNNIVCGCATQIRNASNAVAIGNSAFVNANGAMQFGMGANSEAGTVCFALTTTNDDTLPPNYKLLDSDGTIPAARHASLPAADGTYVLKLVIANGVPTLSWVAA